MVAPSAAGTTAQGVLKRAYGYVDPAGRWHLVTGFKVGDLATEWVGQAPIGSVQAPLDRALASLDLASNYELVRTIEPYVRGRVGRYVDFAAAVRSAIATRLPELLPHVDEVLTFLVLYFGVTDAPQLAT